MKDHPGEHALRKTDEPDRTPGDSAAGCAVVLFDSDGRVVGWDTAAEEVFGYPGPEVLGQHYARFFTHEDVQRGVPRQELSKASAHGRATRHCWQVRKDGLRFWACTVLAALRDDGGSLRGFATVTQDLSERKRLEEELARRTLELQEADRCLALLAHEFRGPLAAISQAAQVLRWKLPSHAEWQSANGIVERQAAHLARLVDDLLAAAGAAHGKLTFCPQPVELAAVVSQAVESCRPLIEARKHRLTVSLPLATRLEADPTRLAQIVTNLLTNAARYTLEGGHIGLTAELLGREVVLRVSDNGIGISAEMLPRIFESFARADHSLVRSAGGLGIGLTLVKSLVELHGGTVQAFSAGTDKGSEFVVRLPALVETAPDPPVAAAGGSPPTCRVLIVDDNRDAAEALAELLTNRRHDVRIACDGPAALQTARTFEADVVLLDLRLPGEMDGRELARRLRERFGDRVLVAALTGYDEEHCRCRGESAFDAHLVKPVRFDVLEALLTKAGSGRNTPAKAGGTAALPAPRGKKLGHPTRVDGNPLAEFRRDFDALCDRFLGELAQLFAPERLRAFEVQDGDGEVIVRAELPGFHQTDMDVRLSGKTLTIDAERREHGERYQRSVEIPAGVDAEKAQATYRHGILEVHIPKAEGIQVKRIPVKAEAGPNRNGTAAGTARRSCPEPL